MAVGRPSALFALALLAAPLLAAPLELKVAGDRVNLRSRPLAEAEVVGQVSAGETLLAPEGIPEGAEWVKVRPPPSTDLWIFSALVSDGIVTADDTYVRCGPGQHFRPVGKVPKGFQVEPRGAQAGDWLRIAPVPTAELYISSAYVLAVPPPPPPAEEPPPEPSNGQTDKPSTASAALAVEAVPAVATAEERESPKKESSDIPAPPAKNEETPPVAEAVPTEPSNGSTVQRSNVPTALAGVEAAPAVEAVPAEPSNGSTVQRSNVPAAPAAVEAPVPPALAGLTLAPVPRQGETVRVRGRLERLSLARAPGFTRYQLTDKAGYSKSAAICRIIGLRGQWFELAGSEIDVEGRLWTLYGDPVPVLDATCVRRVASWEK